MPLLLHIIFLILQKRFYIYSIQQHVYYAVCILEYFYDTINIVPIILKVFLTYKIFQLNITKMFYHLIYFFIHVY